jgi:hypothetical protein
MVSGFDKHVPLIIDDVKLKHPKGLQTLK